MILLVDDDPEFLAEAQRVFASFGEVLPVQKGSLALAVARYFSERLDLALVDLDLPDMSGFNVIEEIRATCPHVRILAFSGTIQRHTLESAKCFGAVAALRKPIGPVWLRAIEDAQSRIAPAARGLSEPRP